jgi:hypothetical protein
VHILVRDNGRVSEPTPAESAARPEQVRVRRAPKIPAFLAVGGALGFFVTVIVTGLYPAGDQVGFATLVAYFSVYGITIGVLLGAIVGIALDRRSRRRARLITAEHETVDPAPAEGDLEQ